MSEDRIKFAYFGSSRLSVIVLDELKKLCFIPRVIVTTPDKPQGRKMILTPNVTKTWAIENGIQVFDPAKPNPELTESLKKINCDVFIVASYGRIIPGAIINLPKHKTLNIHPSLLPKYRGPSPLPTAMLDDEKETGVTIMRIDEEMDHGPIVAQKKVNIREWPTYEDFEEMMAKEGASLLAEILPKWVKGEIKEIPQNHGEATYTMKTKKEDGLIYLSDDPYKNFRKIQAYHEWPKAYFLIKHNGKDLKVKITSATFQEGKLSIEKVIPEGSKEMSFRDFEQGYRKN